MNDKLNPPDLLNEKEAIPTTTKLVTKEKTPLEKLFDKAEYRKKILDVLPKHLTPDRFLQVALSTMLKVPKLEKCSMPSIVQALYTCSQLGIEPDGRRAHLIPYGDYCQLIIDYKGLVELVRRSGDVSYIHADVVCENDEFSYMFGTGSHLKHKPALKNRGDVLCAYSFVKLKDGSEDFDVMNIDEIEAIRSRSKAANSGPWVTDWNEMAKKTVFRRQSKWLPFSAEVRDAIEVVDTIETIEEKKVKHAKPIYEDKGDSFLTSEEEK
jgi:recombination protein RecT